MNRYLGVDVGGTSVKLGIVTDTGKILEKCCFRVDFDHYQTPILKTTLSRTQAFLCEQGISPAELTAIGVSATGQIDVRTGVVVGSAGHIRHYIGSDFLQGFTQAFARPVTVLNDANSAVLGEHWIGRARGCSDVVMVTIGTGVGGGIIVGGKLLSGRIGIAGELGHFTIDQNGVLCSCGNRGCYEQYASMRALVRSVQDILPELPYAISPEELNGKKIFEWFWDGDYRVGELVKAWIRRIAVGLIGLTHLFNPEMLLLGGGVSGEGEPFLQLVREQVFSGVMPRFAEGLRLEAASLGNDAGLIGAIRACQLAVYSNLIND